MQTSSPMQSSAMIFRGSVTDDNTETTVMNHHDNVAAFRQLNIGASKDREPPNSERQWEYPKADTAAVILAEATSSSLPSLQDRLENMHVSEGRSPHASAKLGLSGPQAISEDGMDSIERGRSVPPRVSPSLDEWQFEPEALFSQVYVPVREFDKVNEQRLGLVATQVRARELRRTLRMQRVTVSEKQSKLLQDLRVLVLMGGKRDFDHLTLQLDEIQELNDNLQSAEEAFDELEAELIEKEWELKDAELGLYRRDTDAAPDLDNRQTWKEPAYGTPHTEAIASGVPSLFAGSVEVSTANLPRKSDIDMLRAQLRELELERQQLMQEEMLRKQVGLSLDDDSSFALRTFPVRYAELVHHLERYEERLEEKQEILNGSVILDNSFDQFPTYQYTGDDLEVLARQYTPNDVHESVAPWSDELTLALQDSPQSRDHLLLPVMLLDDNEPIPSPFTAFTVSEDHGLPQSVTYINDWLLYKLRSSSMEILCLRFYLHANTVDAASQATKQLLLSVWYNDESYLWYVESMGRAAESFDSTVRSPSKAIDLHPSPSDPNLARGKTQISLKSQSRSMFAHRDEVRDLNLKSKGLRLSR